MKKYVLKDTKGIKLSRLFWRPNTLTVSEPDKMLKELPDIQKFMLDVATGGDKAICKFTEEFDKASLESLELSADVIDMACDRFSKENGQAQEAIDQARLNIEKFHKTQMRAGRENEVETVGGVRCFIETRPIDRVGLYIPGGTAPLVSTVLMLAIPAKLAGCKEIIMTTPPMSSSGGVPNSILYAAKQCGVDRVFNIGGPQAIAAMAFGTESVPAVDKIFGPGNRYVAAAKMVVASMGGGPAIDMPAGPTELLVIADENARADFVASDLLSQAEHGEDSQVLLATTSFGLADAVDEEVHKQLKVLPRKEIAKRALSNSFTVLTDTLDEAVEFANRYAPEHLILNVEDPNALVPKIANAGSVFLGAYSCEAAGDYASGPNHTLPTAGYARAYSGVSVSDFQKRITFQELSREGAANLAPTVTKLAALEGLEGHKRAMEIRLEDER